MTKWRNLPRLISNGIQGEPRYSPGHQIQVAVDVGTFKLGATRPPTLPYPKARPSQYSASAAVRLSGVLRNFDQAIKEYPTFSRNTRSSLDQFGSRSIECLNLTAPKFAKPI